MPKKKSLPVNQQDIDSLMLQEPAAEWVSYTSRNTVVKRKRASQMTAMEKMGIAKMGITKNELEALKEITGLDYDTLAAGFATARATLINLKEGDRFSFGVSEKIVGLEDIYFYGYEIFGDRQRFNHWMFEPNKALGNSTPFELMNSQFGREEVKNTIGRIAYGVHA